MLASIANISNNYYTPLYKPVKYNIVKTQSLFSVVVAESTSNEYVSQRFYNIFYIFDKQDQIHTNGSVIERRWNTT